MNEITSLLTAVVTMFLLLVVGYAARKFGFLDDRLSKGISNLIICVAQPFMIIGSIIGIQYSSDNLLTGASILAIGVAVHALTAVISHITAKRFRDNDTRRISEFGLTFANCGFLGFPILQAVFGDIGVFWGSFYVIVYNIACWTWGMFVLSRARSEIKMNFVKMIVNYGTTPCLIGLALWFLRVQFPAPVTSLISYMGGLCTPLSMLIIGGQIATIPLKKLVTDGRVYYVCAVRLLVVPTVMILLSRLAGLPQTFSIFVSILSAMPVSANTGMFGEKYDMQPAYAAHCVGMTTALSAATVPLMMLLAGTLYGVFPSWW